MRRTEFARPRTLERAGSRVAVGILATGTDWGRPGSIASHRTDSADESCWLSEHLRESPLLTPCPVAPVSFQVPGLGGSSASARFSAASIIDSTCVAIVSSVRFSSFVLISRISSSSGWDLKRDRKRHVFDGNRR